MLPRLVPAAVLAVAGVYLFQALKLPLGSAARPGAGFYPVIVAVFACVICLVGLVRGVGFSPQAAGSDADDGDPMPALRRVAITTAALAGFCVVMPWTGYPVAAAAFVIVTLLGLGSRPWAAVTIGILGALGSHALFAGLLDVPLPRGPW
jgi:hypothetical protein